MNDAEFEALEEYFARPIGELIAELRRERGLTQEELAATSGYTRAYIAQIEKAHREPSQDAIASILAALGFGDPASIALLSKRITADDLRRMQRLHDLMTMVQERLTPEEWTDFSALAGESGWWILQTASDIRPPGESADAAPEPIPGWGALSSKNQRIVRELVKSLAEKEDC